MANKNNIIELKKAAELGDSHAQYELGIYYAENDTSEDFISWFTKAAEQNHPLAYNKLGICYATGYGVQRDIICAEQMFEKAVEFGYDAGRNLDMVRNKIIEEKEIKPYYLVKITDKQWANKLMDGEIFMRSLFSFGDLLNEDKEFKNNFRGDILEGLSESFADGSNSNFFIDLSDGVRQFNGAGQIDVLLAREKIFSLYSLEYDEIQNKFIEPNKRLIEFGDTAVLILNSKEFLRRVFSCLLSQFGNSFWLSFKRVSYDVDLSKQLQYDEFHKSDSYSWQNEFRIALDLSEGKIDKETWDNMTDFCRLQYMEFGGSTEYDNRLESIAESLVINIGDIRHICTQVPTTEFVNFNSSNIQINISKPTDNIVPLEIPRKPRVTVYKPVLIR